MKPFSGGRNMENVEESSDLINLMNRAIAREIQVSIQYILQHSVWNVKASIKPDDKAYNKRSKFVGTHSPVWLPGSSLKKVAITEMRHAEAIAERVVRLGGEPTTKPDPVIIGNTIKEILEIIYLA